MESQKSIISSHAMTSAIAGMMFFAPLVKNSLDSDPILTPEDKKFVIWYIQVWYANLTFLLIVLAAALINLFRVNSILSWIITIWSFAVYIITLFSIFACANRLSMWSENESIMQKIPQKGQLLKSFIPIINFSIRFRKDDYSMPYWRLKESIFLRTFFVFGTLLLGQSFGVGVLIIIAARILMLLLNIDIVPLSMKKALNSCFSCNSGEITSYLFAPIISKIKKIDYEIVLQKEKDKYVKWQSFWMWIILQYIMFLWILYLLYSEILYITRVDEIILFVAIFFRLIRVITFYVHKKSLLRIPILSEFTSLIFN